LSVLDAMIAAMGTWDIGHFDNDTAADFSGDLDDLLESEREGLVRKALVETIESEEFLDSYEACKAVASAVQALDRVMAPESELLELWDETEYGPAWRQSVADLRAVLLT
jgi:hypothetical protein